MWLLGIAPNSLDFAVEPMYLFLPVLLLKILEAFYYAKHRMEINNIITCDSIIQCVSLMKKDAGGTAGNGEDTFWIGCSFKQFCSKYASYFLLGRSSDVKSKN